jgi:hypothetical protein
VFIVVVVVVVVVVEKSNIRISNKKKEIREGKGVRMCVCVHVRKREREIVPASKGLNRSVHRRTEQAVVTKFKLCIFTRLCNTFLFGKSAHTHGLDPFFTGYCKTFLLGPC